MKKILPIIVVGFLVLSGIGAVGINTNNMESINDNIESKSRSLNVGFTSPIIEQYDKEYIEINCEDVSTYLSEPGKPFLPKVVKSFELPFGVKNVKVEVIPNNVHEQYIKQKIRPSSPHLPLIQMSQEINIIPEENEVIYTSKEPYPSNWFKYKVGCGLNSDFKRVTHVAVHVFPVRYSPGENKLIVAESAEIKITYDPSNIKMNSKGDEYDLVIIAPSIFKSTLNYLVDHKNNFGVRTFIKTTEEIYTEQDGIDTPEEIKLFIKEAIEEHNITYVLLVGGINNRIFANPRENKNYGAKWWHLPARYNNFYDDPAHPLSFAKIYDPGILCDLYYADVYKEGGEFDDWDSNDDGYIAAWGMDTKGYAVENDTIDMYPDVSLGRLACRNTREVIYVVNKIIKYEKTLADDSWFKKMIVISGDGFFDQRRLNIEWDTKELPNGKYTIIGQSKVGDEPFGPPDEIEVTIDKDAPTSLHFNHDDHLRIDEYPSDPIAEIVSVTDGDILGYNDSYYYPTEGQAYGNTTNGWGVCEYIDEVLYIRGKSYDPSPYGNITDICVRVYNEADEMVFEGWEYGVEMYYEGEWVCGEKTLKGGGGALYYMPEEFEREILWASNGNYNESSDITNALAEGCGFAFMSGHGSPNSWSDHYPGIPGNRRHGSTPSFTTLAFKPDFLPLFPTNKIKTLGNYDKLPVLLVGGCHNSQFNVSMIPTLLDKGNKQNYWCYGVPTPECFNWMFVAAPRQGAIASIGNTGLGYGVPGKDCLIEGLDGGICIQFFKNYSYYYNQDGYAILGDVFTSTLQTYCNNFDMDFLDHAKSLTQWTLFGDPSLRLGGYDEDSIIKGFP